MNCAALVGPERYGHGKLRRGEAMLLNEFLKNIAKSSSWRSKLKRSLRLSKKSARRWN